MNTRYAFIYLSFFALIAACNKSQLNGMDGSSKLTVTLNSQSELIQKLPNYFADFKNVIDAGGTNYPELNGAVHLASGVTNYTNQAGLNEAINNGADPNACYVFNPNHFVSGSPSAAGAYGAVRGGLARKAIGDIVLLPVMGALMCYFPCTQFGIPGICSNCLASTCNVTPGSSWNCPNSPVCFPDLCAMAAMSGLPVYDKLPF